MMMGESAARAKFLSIFFTLIQWAAGLAVAGAVWFAVNHPSLSAYRASQSLLNRNKAEVHQMEEEFARLGDEKHQLEVGGFSTEKAIRERFKMVKPGEKVIFIEPESEKGTASTDGGKKPEARVEKEQEPEKE